MLMLRTCMLQHKVKAMNILSLDDINKKSPYLVKRAEDGDYVFQTTKGIIYGIGFIENDPHKPLLMTL